MAGVSLSGDLKDPKQSIPLGTLLAVGSGFVVYLAVPIALAAAAAPEELNLDENARRLIRAALQRSGGNKTRAAELLGISFRSLRYKLKKYEID